MAFYKVTQEGVETPRLVEADNPSQALKHVSASVFTVSDALNAGEVADLMDQDVKREKAAKAD